MLWKRIRSPAALSTLGFFSTVPIGFNRSPLSSVMKMSYMSIYQITPISLKRVLNVLLFWTAEKDHSMLHLKWINMWPQFTAMLLTPTNSHFLILKRLSHQQSHKCVNIWGFAGTTCHSGYFSHRWVLQVLWRLLKSELFFKRMRCEKMQRWRYQEQMAMWTRGTPQSSVGPCSRTPWCSPRLLDNPEETGMIRFVDSIWRPSTSSKIKQKRDKRGSTLIFNKLHKGLMQTTTTTVVICGI